MKTRSCLLTALLAGTVGASAFAEVVKIAHIDPYSGPVAGLNQNGANMLRYSLDLANAGAWAGPNVTFEIVPFDGKGSSQESLLQLKNATDQGIRYVFQGLSSSIGLALIDAVNRHNERNPGKEVLFITPSDQASEMTNEKCSFWFFRFDSNVEMRNEGLTSFVAKDKSIKKVYLINMNYAMGQQVSAGVKTSLKRKRPDIEIVGDDLHAMLQVKDFTPYVAKIRASGADAIITANWSADLILLVKAMKEAGLKTPMYTFNAATTGIPTALASAGADNVKVVTYWIPNENVKLARPVADPFKAKYNDDFSQLPWYNGVRMLTQAMKNAKSTEPVAVARAMEGMKITSLNGEVEMRRSDHQVQQSLVIGDWVKADSKDVYYDLEKTGYGFKPVDKLDPYVASMPTSCQMKRPG
jgi:branched-chain amino acid transport system substrate-binding protein